MGELDSGGKSWNPGGAWDGGRGPQKELGRSWSGVIWGSVNLSLDRPRVKN